MSDKPQPQRILEAATDLLAFGGAEALRVRDIAAAADCSTMGVYSHFGGKDGIVEAIFIDGFERFEGALRDRWPGPAKTRMRRIGGAYRTWALANPGAYGVMFANAVPGFEASPHAQAVALRSFGVLLDGVAEEQEAGRVDAGRDTAEVAWALWGLVHGLVMLEIAGMAIGETPSKVLASFEGALAAAMRGFAPSD